MAAEGFVIDLLSYAGGNPVVAALLVIAYLQYSLRYGAAAEYFSTLQGLVAVVIALSEEVEGVDEDAVADRFDGGDSSEYLHDGGFHNVHALHEPPPGAGADHDHDADPGDEDHDYDHDHGQEAQ